LFYRNVLFCTTQNITPYALHIGLRVLVISKTFPATVKCVRIFSSTKGSYCHIFILDRADMKTTQTRKTAMASPVEML